MHRAIKVNSRVIEGKQMTRLQSLHKKNIMMARAITSTDNARPLLPKNLKKEQIAQERFTEIQRQNRILLQKIHHIMGKRCGGPRERVHRSLHQPYRRRKQQIIEEQNIRFLKRLTEKKSEYEAVKFQRQWSKRKNEIAHLSIYPICLDSIKTEKKQSKELLRQEMRLGGLHFLISLQLTRNSLLVVGTADQLDPLTIEIPREEAYKLLHDECGGKPSRLLERLRYQNGELYLLN